ncbi:penicillin acylase family protein [Picrophilus oshimae]|uniref:Penicillin acylase n=1 Tax=Picrophilus torridus (strain ATCC 700027 / DSM 9790 / JCM 10055 / NBRC 100828 / KAW 2/3) TaxID=1122961 RepID=Q6KYV6_PICTO|nr:penicillin acylase family protein [Picrophilus oshimae]AAT44096.1 penicillin acylase [Picrophilus oshimae DSM 9789]
MLKKRFFTGLIVIIIVFILLFISLTPLSPFYELLNPETGIYARPPPYSSGVSTFTIERDNRSASVTVYYENCLGFIGIYSNHNWSLFYEQGYLEARYRLAQIEIIKAEATGTLASIIGKSELSSDILSRELLNCPVAREEFQNLSRSSYTYMALSNFVAGINSYINGLTYKDMPLLFKTLNYRPGDWNVTDVLAIQQSFLWENTPANFDPLYFQYALEKMPENIVRALYPAYPAGIQNPIVPYKCNPSVYKETGDINNLSLYTPSVNITGNLNFSVSRCLEFPSSRSFSNDWAVNGIKTDNTSALLANDPHLTTSVPSIWMGFQLVSPGMNVIGVVFPGFPGIILGHNRYIAWGATNGQIQETYFYAEVSKGYTYLSYNKWLHYKIINETIDVRGSSPYHLMIRIANNGVVMFNESGTEIAMDWTGMHPTYEITFFLNIDRSRDIKGFVSNLTKYFKVAVQNWAVADSNGNIGIYPYGEYPVIEHGDPRGILNGTGISNWIGFVPLRYEPYLYDPARGFVFSDNQITVSDNYPYYIGWDYESGYRADEAYHLLNSSYDVNTDKMKSIQLTVHDYTTNIFLKPLLRAISRYYYNTSYYNELSNWNGNMSINSTAATIFYFWENNTLNDTFMPYMEKYNINQSNGLFNVSFFLGPDDMYHGPLIEDLVNWTLNDPYSRYFDNPLNGETRNFYTIALTAFNQTIMYLNERYGGIPAWGNIHKRYLVSFFGINAMNTMDVPAAGDGNTINAAYGIISDFGPSWRLIVNMSRPEDAIGIYPGGISENPLSKYYDNNFIPWNNGLYYKIMPENEPEVFRYE